MNHSLTIFGSRFAEALQAASKSALHTKEQHASQPCVHVSGAGRTVTHAYEQLRNAAEYTEEHLLLQRAIRRFYKRTFLSRDVSKISNSGEELIIELTLAGYLQNDSIATVLVQRINQLASQYFNIYKNAENDAWSLDVLAVEAEHLLNPEPKRDVFIQFAVEYFASGIDPQKALGSNDPYFEIALFVAAHRALLKSDAAIIRTSLLHRYQQTPDSPAFQQTNEMIDTLLNAQSVDTLYRIVNRQGAALRILWRLIDENPNTAELLQSRESFLYTFTQQITNEYARIDEKITKGIVKSVIFLIITKFLVGLAIEIPYDLLFYGMILWIPLTINLLFPPIYMILLRLTLSLPDHSNAQALTDTIDTLLYSDKKPSFAYRTSAGFGVGFNIIYALLFVLIFGGAGFGLWLLGFTFVHLIIFFVFLSTASFLGFRLSRQIREIEAVDSKQNGVSMVRDFLYIPFVAVGRWMSEKYSRVNIVAMVLDMLIELPLKTVLHLVRQWGMFISSKKDEL